MDDESEIVTDEQFASLSGAMVRDVRWFVSESIAPEILLHMIVLWGYDPYRWIGPFRHKITRTRQLGDVVEFSPWKSGESAATATAHEMAAEIGRHLLREIFIETVHFEDYGECVTTYVSANRSLLIPRLEIYQEQANSPEWLRLAATIESEVAHCVTPQAFEEYRSALEPGPKLRKNGPSESKRLTDSGRFLGLMLSPEGNLTRDSVPERVVNLPRKPANLMKVVLAASGSAIGEQGKRQLMLMDNESSWSFAKRDANSLIVPLGITIAGSRVIHWRIKATDVEQT